MKKTFFYVVLFLFTILVMSCEVFSNPLYKVSRDISDMVDSMSTGDLVGNIDKLASDPSKSADILNELSNRDQKEIEKLSQGEKEKLLEAGIGTVLPTSKLGEAVDSLVSGGENTDFNKVMEKLCEETPSVNTKVLETALSDKDVLSNTDAGTIALSAASLVVATIKNESDESSVDAKMEDFQAAVAEATDEADLKKNLQDKGFSPASIESLTVAMNASKVLQGTAGEGMPNRKDDLSSLNLGGQDVGSLLGQMSGGK